MAPGDLNLGKKSESLSERLSESFGDEKGEVWPHHHEIEIKQR